MKREPLLRLALMWACLGAAQPVPAQEVDEDQFTAFLYNAAKFVEWPALAFRRADHPVLACILGKSPLGSALEHVPTGNVLRDREFLVKRIPEMSHCSPCRILFVSSSQRKQWAAIVGKHKGWILTVGEDDGFALSVGIVDLKIERNRVRIRVNVEAAQRKNLQNSSRRLSLSGIIPERTR